MCKPFDKLKEFLKEDGTSEIDGLKDIFENQILNDQLDLTKVEEVRKIALVQELQKVRIADLSLLTKEQIDVCKAKEAWQNLEKARKKVIEFRDKQQEEADSLEKDDRKEDIDDIEKDVKKEEDSIKAHIKELENIAKGIKAIDDDIKAKETDKAKKEAEYEDNNTVAKINEDIAKKKEEWKTEYQAFKDKHHAETQKIISPGSSYAKLIETLETKKRDREEYLRKVTQSKVIIKYIEDNRHSIVEKLAQKVEKLAQK